MTPESYLLRTAAQNSELAERIRVEKRQNGPLAASLVVVIAVAFAVLAPALLATPTITVNSTADSSDTNVGDGVCATAQGVCTLRAAIQEANFDPAATTISFAIPQTDSNHTAGVWTIPLTNELPPVTTTTTIDATSQPGWMGEPVVVLDGANTNQASGFVVETSAPDSQIRGFSLSLIHISEPTRPY